MDDRGNSDRGGNVNTNPSPQHKLQQPALQSNNTNNNRYRNRSSAFSDLERSQTVDKFGNVFMERIGDAMSSGKLSEAWQGSNRSGGGIGGMFSFLTTDYSPGANNNIQYQSKRINPDDYAAERKLMEPHLTPFIWGGSCMFVTLISMRTGRWYQTRNAGNALSRSTRTYNTNTGHNRAMDSLQDMRHGGQQQQLHSSSPFNPKDELKNEMMSSISTLPVDMAVSMLFGISTTIFLTESDCLLRDFSSAPLLEGKSAMAEELCVPFQKQMDNINGMYHTYSPYNTAKDMPEQRQVVPYSELWRDENLGGFDSLRAIRDFVANCNEREKIAQQVVADDTATTQQLMETKIPPQNVSGGDFIE